MRKSIADEVIRAAEVERIDVTVHHNNEYDVEFPKMNPSDTHALSFLSVQDLVACVGRAVTMSGDPDELIWCFRHARVHHKEPRSLIF